MSRTVCGGARLSAVRDDVNRSLRIKLVFVMLLIIVLLMIVVLVFLIQGVQDFYTSQFYEQMESAFTETELVNELRLASEDSDAIRRLDGVLTVFSGELGIDRNTRHYHILDSTTGEVLKSSVMGDDARIEITINILEAMQGENALKRSLRAGYMDVAVPIIA